jgi:hypothetical protein
MPACLETEKFPPFNIYLRKAAMVNLTNSATTLANPECFSLPLAPADAAVFKTLYCSAFKFFRLFGDGYVNLRFHRGERTKRMPGAGLILAQRYNLRGILSPLHLIV